MELLADRDPEEARKLLDTVLERMMEAVHRYGGTVNQVMGDGIMALFGAPLAHEDHAVRACYAALDMQARMQRYTEQVRHAHGIEVQIRVGLNSGEVVVRAIGSDLRMDYTAVGQTTHRAARMEQLAPPGTIRLTADTLRLVEGYIEVKPLGPVPVKGLETPIDVYEMVGAGPRRSRLHAAAARGLTRFVGREAELEALRHALARAAAGHGQIVAVVGEPGVGKSRLVWEITHSHRVHGWLVLQAGSVSYGKATSYLPVIDLLKGYFAIEDRDGPRAVREKLTGKLLTLDRAQEGSLPALLSLLDVPIDDPQWPTLDPPQRRRRTLDAVKRLLLRESQAQPLLVVLEDLHWIDGETQALLDGLVESLPATRLLLLVNYRPEYQHPLGSRTYYTQLRLDSLLPESAAELLGVLLGPDTGLDPLKRVLVERTEGNPFFWRKACGRSSRPGPSPASAVPIDWHDPCRPSRSRPQCRPCWPPASTGCRSGTRRSCRRRRSLGRTSSAAELQEALNTLEAKGYEIQSIFAIGHSVMVVARRRLQAAANRSHQHGPLDRDARRPRTVRKHCRGPSRRGWRDCNCQGASRCNRFGSWTARLEFLIQRTCAWSCPSTRTKRGSQGCANSSPQRRARRLSCCTWRGPRSYSSARIVRISRSTGC